MCKKNGHNADQNQLGELIFDIYGVIQQSKQQQKKHKYGKSASDESEVFRDYAENEIGPLFG
jgi:hypothetical protein